MKQKVLTPPNLQDLQIVAKWDAEIVAYALKKVFSGMPPEGLQSSPFLCVLCSNGTFDCKYNFLKHMEIVHPEIEGPRQ